MAVPHAEARGVALVVGGLRARDGAGEGEVEDDARDDEEDEGASKLIAWPWALAIRDNGCKAGQEDNCDNGDPEELEDVHVCLNACLGASQRLERVWLGVLHRSQYVARCCLHLPFAKPSVSIFCGGSVPTRPASPIYKGISYLSLKDRFTHPN